MGRIRDEGNAITLYVKLDTYLLPCVVSVVLRFRNGPAMSNDI